MNEYTTNEPIGSTNGNTPAHLNPPPQFSTGANPPAHQGSKWQTELHDADKYNTPLLTNLLTKETPTNFSGSIYKHIVYNPHMRNIDAVINQAQEDGKDWQFSHAQPVTEYEWVAVFEKWIP